MKKLLFIGGLLFIIGAGCTQVTPQISDTNTGQGVSPGESAVEDSMEEKNTDLAMEKDVVQINVTGKNFEFSPAEIRVKQGDKIRIQFMSTQGFHDFVIDEFNIKTKQLQTGQSDTVEFVADKAGEFEYYCSVGSHRQLGMVGKFIVEDSDAMMSEDEENTDSMMEDDSMKEVSKLDGNYENYNSSKIARAENGDVVLFFHAAWCPTCRGLDKNINENKSDIPDNVSILKVDYDNSTELKKKYGVTYQHTFVQVDAQGNQITKWSASPTLSALLAEIK